MPFNSPLELARRLALDLASVSETQIQELQACVDSAHSLMLNYTDRSCFICPTAGAETGTATSVAANTLNDTAQSWTTDEWEDYYLVDSNSKAYKITSNTSSALTVDAEGATPGSGAYSIDTMLTEEYDPTSGTRLYLRALPIVAVGNVYEDDDVAEDRDEDTDYVIHAKDGYLRADAGWYGPEDFWTIAYRGGYQRTDNEYNELAWIEREIAAALWKRGGVLHVSADQIGMGYPNAPDLTADVDILLARHLAPYRLYGVLWRR